MNLLEFLHQLDAETAIAMTFAIGIALVMGFLWGANN